MSFGPVMELLSDSRVYAPDLRGFGEKDTALTAGVARKSGKDAGCEVEWRPLAGVGHFVALEAPEKLAFEIGRLLET